MDLQWPLQAGVYSLQDQSYSTVGSRPGLKREEERLDKEAETPIRTRSYTVQYGGCCRVCA